MRNGSDRNVINGAPSQDGHNDKLQEIASTIYKNQKI